jgi:MFS family permease
VNRKLILSIAIGNALVPLNSTMLVVALPAIARDAGTDIAAASWLITTYLIAMAALQPIGGRLGDRFGRRRLMLGALAYFGIASVGASLSVGLPLLAFFRLQQALAGALIVPNGLGILRRAAGERAGMHFGLTSAMSGAGATLGPLLGGLLTAIDWRLVFIVNVPVVALAFFLARSTIPEERARPETKFDVVGVVFLGVVLSAAAWLLTSLGHGSPDAGTVALAVAVVVGAVLFVRYELAQPDAALPPALFRIRAFTAANAAIAFANLSLYATLLAVPALLAADASSTVLVGFALTALSAAMVVLGPRDGLARRPLRRALATRFRRSAHRRRMSRDGRRHHARAVPAAVRLVTASRRGRVSHVPRDARRRGRRRASALRRARVGRRVHESLSSVGCSARSSPCRARRERHVERASALRRPGGERRACRVSRRWDCRARRT